MLFELCLRYDENGCMSMKVKKERFISMHHKHMHDCTMWILMNQWIKGNEAWGQGV
jgi:hypothetical protein